MIIDLVAWKQCPWHIESTISPLEEDANPRPTKVLSFLRRSLIRGRPLLQPQSYTAVSFLRRPLLQPQSLGNKTPHHTVSPNATKKRKSHKESHIKGTDAFRFGTVTSRYVLAEVTQRLTSAKESSSKPALQSHEDLAKKLQILEGSLIELYSRNEWGALMDYNHGSPMPLSCAKCWLRLDDWSTSSFQPARETANETGISSLSHIFQRVEVNLLQISCERDKIRSKRSSCKPSA
ncbi:hypothetical protein JHK84_048451 [Glycine max]|nr:hypothetical protein JHK84_048451 [Glycine max]